MRFAIEFSADAERDFDLIFDHLFESYLAFGESTEEALDHAAQRVMDIRKAADRLASLPLRGTGLTTSCRGSAFWPSAAPSTGSTSISRCARSVFLPCSSAGRITSDICWSPPRQKNDGLMRAITTPADCIQPKSTADNARSSVSTIRSHSARVITSGGDMVIVLP